MRCTTIGGSWSCSHTDSYLPLASGGVYGTKVAIVPYLRGVTIAACAVLLSMSVALHLGVLAAVLLSVSVAKHFAACAVIGERCATPWCVGGCAVCVCCLRYQLKYLLLKIPTEVSAA